MGETLSDGEDLLGARPTEMPGGEDLLGPRPQPNADPLWVGAEADQFAAAAEPLGHVLRAFGQGAMTAWENGENLGYSDDVNEALKKAGIYNDTAKGQGSWMRSYNEALIRPLVAGTFGVVGAFGRGFGAAVSGGQAAAQQAGEEIGDPQLGREIAAFPEAFPLFGAELGLLHAPHVMDAAEQRADALARQLSRSPLSLHEVDRASELGIIGPAGKAGWYETPYVPGTIKETYAPGALGPGFREGESGIDQYSPSAIPPADVHEAARRVDPTTFHEYDALTERRDALRTQIEDAQLQLRQQAEAQAPHTDEIADLERRLEDTTPRLAKKYEARLEPLRAARDAFLDDEFTMAALTRDTPEIQRMRQQLQEADYSMRDLSPQVSAAYREAARQFPEHQAEAPVAREPAPAAEQPAAAQPIAAAAPAAEVAPAEAPRVVPAAAPTAAPALSIAEDVARKLVAAGRPQAEANAAGQLWQHYYETRAARFGGKRGTGAELYREEGRDIRGAPQGGRGGMAAGKTRLTERPAEAAPAARPAEPATADVAAQQPAAAAQAAPIPEKPPISRRPEEPAPAPAAEAAPQEAASQAPASAPIAAETPRPAPSPIQPATPIPTAAPASSPIGLQSLDPSTIKVDAARFQFKAGGDEAGVTDRLQGVQTFDPMLAGTVMVWRDASGQDWIADGHQRLGLANRAQAAGQQGIRLNAFVMTEADGITAEKARALAAAKNIAEGTGTPIDAAKIIRHAQETGIELPALPPRSVLVRDGQGLARLGPEAFGAAVNEVVPAAQGAMVGRLVADHAQQVEAIRILHELRPENARQAESVIREMLATGTEAGTQDSLFGKQDFASSVVLERAKIIDEATRQLGRDRQTFRTLVTRAEEIQGEGNQLAGAQNVARLTTDEQAAQLLQSLATTRGPVSDQLSAIAREFKAGDISRADAGRRFLGVLRRGIEEDTASGPDAGGARSGEPAQGTAPAVDLLGRPITEAAPARTAEPTIRTDPNQAVMPGMEPSAVQAQASRDQAGRGGIGPAGEVRPADEGLFATPEPESRELFQERGDPGQVPLYSAVGRAVDDLRQAKGTGAQMLAMIQKTAGVKAEEVKWLGLDDWLRGQPSVTREQIADYVRANSLDVREVTKSDAPPPGVEDKPRYHVVDQNGDQRGEFNTWEEARAYLDNPPSFIDASRSSIGEHEGPSSAVSPTKFGQYQLPGGSNYREVLITLPVQKHSDVFRIAGGGPETMRGTTLWRMSPIKSIEDIPQWRQYNSDFAGRVADMSDARLFDALQRARAGERGTEAPGAYQGSHWDEPNVLAHLRMSDRTDASGAKVLLVEEVQSDWHQKGRKSGYALPEAETSRLHAREQELIGKGADATPAEKQEWADIRNRLQAQGVPDAPFKTTWPQMVMRRAITYAVDHGYDRISWTPGDVQADRYSLAKQVDSIIAIKRGDTFDLTVTDNNRRQHELNGLSAQQLADNVGKEMADRIAQQPDEMHRYAGEGLKVGGGGMKAFYDRTLPNEVQKIVGKFGAQVGKSEIETGLTQGSGTRDAVWHRAMSDRLMEASQLAEDEGANHGVVRSLTNAAERLDDPTSDSYALLHGLSDAARAYLDRKGGIVDSTPRPVSVHSVEITPRLRDAVSQEGLPLFQQGEGGPRGQTARAPQAVITLFGRADASTFLHETGHVWLEDLMADAVHPQAPADLITDAQTVRDWLGAKQGDTISRAQHEKFARGFERYLMEGVAPSRGLDRIFAQFKDWLTRIYKTVLALKAPITDDIRDVFDRMLAKDPQPTTVAPEPAAAGFEAETQSRPPPAEPPATPPSATPPAIRTIREIMVAEGVSPNRARTIQEREIAARGAWKPGAPAEAPEANVASDLKDIHVADVAETPPEQAEAAADQIKDEVAETVTTHAPEIADVVAGGTGAEAGGGAAAAGEAGRGGAGPGAATDAGTDRGPPGGIDQGGGGAEAKGAGPAGEPKPAGPAEQPASPHATIDGESDLVDKAGNIRLDNLNAPEDVKDVLRLLAAQNDDFMTARGGVIPDVQRKAMADALGLTAENFEPQKPEGVSPSVWADAVQKLTFQTADEAARLGKAFGESGSPEAGAAYLAARQRLLMVADHFSTLTAEAGRTLRVFDKAAFSFVGDMVATMERDTGRTLFQMQQEAKAVGAMETTAQRSKMLQDARDLSTGQKVRQGIISYFINNLISGPITHAGYSAGNTVWSLFKATAFTAAEATIDTARVAFGAMPADRVYYGEVGAQLYGMLRGTRDGIVPGWKAFKTGVSYMEGADLLAAEVVGKGQAMLAGTSPLGEAALRPQRIPGTAGYVLETPSRAVSMIHTVFYAMNYERNIARLAYRSAANEGLEGAEFANRIADLTQNPTQPMVAMAHDDALTTVLMKRPPYGSGQQHFVAAVNSSLPAKLVMPFMQIGMNILDEGLIKSTPLGLASQTVRDNLFGRNGEVARSQQYARIMVGSGVAMGVMGLAAEGLITGGGPSDPRERMLKEATGWKAYSLRIGDTYIPYRKYLGPLGPLIGAAANIHEVAHLAGQGELTKAVGSAVLGFTEVVADETWMMGLASLVDATRHWDRDGWRYIQNLALDFIPFSVGMGQTARLVDQYQREAHSMADKLRNKIPGLSQGLYPQRDWTGTEIASHTMMSPSVDKNDRTMQAMQAAEFYPAKLSREIMGVPLTPKQYDDYARTAGRLAKGRLDALVATPGFATQPAGLQYKAMAQTLESSRLVAETWMKLQPENANIVRQAMAAKEAAMQGKTRAEVKDIRRTAP